MDAYVARLVEVLTNDYPGLLAMAGLRERLRPIHIGAGIAVTSIGHAHPRVVRALQEQVATLAHTSNLYFTRPQALLDMAGKI